MSRFIPLSVPNLKGNELKYITEAVETEWVSTAGPYIAKFEAMVADFVGVAKAVACQSGTAGLFLSLLEAGVRRGDLVIVPTVTFVAAVNPVAYVGAEPVFMDCDDSLCIDPVKVREYCEQLCKKKDGALYEKQSGKRVSAVVPVHVFGNMADMEAIMDTAAEFGLAVIEDATEALGTRYTEGRYAGKYAGTIGDFGVYSFNGNKIMTTGGGGMLVARDTEKLKHMQKLSIQAKADESDHFYDHDEIGYNYRLTNIQAALGVAQTEQLGDFIAAKKRSYEQYLKNGIKLMPFREGIAPNYWFFSLFTGGRVRETMDALKERGIDSRPIWKLIHTLKPYAGARTYKIEKAIYYYENILNIPCSTNLTAEDVDTVSDAIKEILPQ